MLPNRFIEMKNGSCRPHKSLRVFKRKKKKKRDKREKTDWGKKKET